MNVLGAKFSFLSHTPLFLFEESPSFAETIFSAETFFSPFLLVCQKGKYVYVVGNVGQLKEYDGRAVRRVCQLVQHFYLEAKHVCHLKYDDQVVKYGVQTEEHGDLAMNIAQTIDDHVDLTVTNSGRVALNVGHAVRRVGQMVDQAVRRVDPMVEYVDQMAKLVYQEKSV